MMRFTVEIELEREDGPPQTKADIAAELAETLQTRPLIVAARPYDRGRRSSVYRIGKTRAEYVG